MPIFNSLVCPQCNYHLPFFIKPSLRISRGLLAPYLKCPQCGQICRQKIYLLRAIWVWPLTVCFLLAEVYDLRVFLIFLYHGALILYIMAAVMALFPLFIGLRLGKHLVKVETHALTRSRFRKWFMPTAGLILFSLLFAYYTRDWVNVMIGIIIGLVVWAFFYSFGKRKKGNEP